MDLSRHRRRDCVDLLTDLAAGGSGGDLNSGHRGEAVKEIHLFGGGAGRCGLLGHLMPGAPGCGGTGLLGLRGVRRVLYGVGGVSAVALGRAVELLLEGDFVRERLTLRAGRAGWFVEDAFEARDLPVCGVVAGRWREFDVELVGEARVRGSR